MPVEILPSRPGRTAEGPSTGVANTLQAENDAFYERVKEAYQKSDHFAHLPLNLFWGGENMDLLGRIIRSRQSPAEKVREILATDLYSHGAVDPEVGQRQVEWWLQHLQQNYDIGWKRISDVMQESEFTPAGTQFQHEGRRLSPDFLRHFTLALEVQRHCKIADEPVNILELGAGYGGFARILKLFRPRASYVIVDIPETLYFSSLFLQLNFPDAKVHYVTELPKSRLDVSQYDFVFVPTIFAEAVLGNRFELFYNTCSLGEMKNAVIRYWMGFVQEKLDIRYFFGVNRYLNTIDPEAHEFRLDENQASVSFDAHWRMVQWELEPAFSRCPYHETFATRNLQVVAERLPLNARSPQANRQESERLAARLSKQDWLVYAGSDNAMRLRDNFLAHDLGKTGPLFQLWEAIRLSPSVDNVSMMLVYLYQLRRERPFEEMFYYLDRLESLRQEASAASSGQLAGLSADLIDRRTLTQPWGVCRTPQLVESGYCGYNLVRYQSKVFAVAQSLGPFNVTQLAERTKGELCAARQLFIGDSAEAVKKAIDESGWRGVPRLVKENYRGFNFVEFGDKVYALALSLGPVDLARMEPAAFAKWQSSRLAFVAAAVPELTRLVGGEGSVAPAPSSLSKANPDYRIVEHEHIFYAMPARYAAIDLAHPAERNLPEILSARSHEGLSVAIDQATRVHSQSQPARLVERDYCGFRLFALAGIFLATRSGGDSLDLEKLRSGQHGAFFASETLSGLKGEVDASNNGGYKRTERTLVIGAGSADQTRELIARVGCQNATVLVSDPCQALHEWPSIVASSISPDVTLKLRALQPELVVVPYGPCLGQVAWEQAVAPFCRRLLAVFPDGSSRLYHGDHFSRILYNMAYLRSMYRRVPSLAGRNVLEIGCSDGLTCDLVSHEGPASVTGVDMLETVGLRYNNPRCKFQRLDATTLPFADASFDLVYSIATFEHVSDPLAALKGMKQVLRPGGYGYVQAAPLYYSPFGHHMFGYFDHFPWIHVRLSKTEIAEYARANGIASKIEAARGGRVEDYIDAMINTQHINGKLLHEYRLEEFASLPGIEIVSFAPSFEGENLVTPEILAQTKPVRREDLVTHGFELVFRVK